MYEYAVIGGPGVLLAHGVADIYDWNDLLSAMVFGYDDRYVMAQVVDDDAKAERFH